MGQNYPSRAAHRSSYVDMQATIQTRDRRDAENPPRGHRPTVASAADLAERGFAVFPCLPSKAPATPRGFHDATNDPGRVIELWRRWPGPLIGVPTGSVNRFDAIDIDPRHGGDVWYAAHRNNLPDTRIHQTRSGGWHLLFNHLDGVRCSAGKIAPGVDVRGTGGYIVWWETAGCPVLSRGSPADWPDWLCPSVVRQPEPPHVGAAAITGAKTDQLAKRYRRFAEKLLRNVLNAPDGAKHDVLLRMARALGGIITAAGIAEVDAHRWLVAAVPATALDLDAAAKTAWAGLRSGMAQPFDLEDRPWQRT
jgi:Bifunctional DNA primase/polymerase, N-terminal